MLLSNAALQILAFIVAIKSIIFNNLSDYSEIEASRG